MLKPVGFWSYARQDDAHSDGQLSQLRALIGKALALRQGEELTLWQDIAAIPFGADWAATIERTIGQVTFFIPIVTPRYLKSENCLSEFRAFRERMRELERDDLIFPIYYVDVETMSAADTVFDDELVALRRQQWADFRSHTFDDPKSPQVRQWCDRFAAGVLDAMRRAAPPQARPTEPPRAAAAETASQRQPAAAPRAAAEIAAPPPAAVVLAPAPSPGAQPQALEEPAESPPLAEPIVQSEAKAEPTRSSPPRFAEALRTAQSAAPPPASSERAESARAAPRWALTLEVDPTRIGLRLLAFGWFYALLVATVARDLTPGGMAVYLGPPVVLSLLRVNLPRGAAISLVAMALAQQALGQALMGVAPSDSRTTVAFGLAIVFAVYLALSAALYGLYRLGRRYAQRFLRPTAAS